MKNIIFPRESWIFKFLVEIKTIYNKKKHNNNFIIKNILYQFLQHVQLFKQKMVSNQTGVDLFKSWNNDKASERDRDRVVVMDFVADTWLSSVFMYAETTCARNAYLNSNDDSQCSYSSWAVNMRQLILLIRGATTIHIACCALLRMCMFFGFSSYTNTTDMCWEFFAILLEYWTYIHIFNVFQT